MHSPHETKNQSQLFIVFAVLLFGLGLVDYFFYRTQTNAVKQQAQQQLAAIAELKVQQITRWQQERLGDAHVLRENVFIRTAVADWLRLGLDAEQREQINQWLQSYVRSFDYREALLLDPEGKVLAATPNALPVFADTLDLARGAAESGKPALSDLRVTMGMESYMELVAPLHNLSKQKLLGYVVFRIDPQRFLFPLIQSWPLHSESAETLLVEKRGNDILYLNELRHQKGTSMRLVLPADQSALPSSYAVRGETLVMEGVDYRKTVVLAATRPIPGTPWSMVTKVDLSEVLEPLYGSLSLVALVSALLLLSAGWIISHLSRLQRDIEDKLRRQSAQHAAILENMPLGISVFDEKLQLRLWNPVFKEVLNLPEQLITPGVAFEELIRYRAAHGEYGPGDPEELTRSRVALALKFEAHRFEHTRHNGRTNLVQGRPYLIDDQLAGFITTYTDITDRKQAEIALQRQHLQLNTIIENMPSGVSLMDGNLNCTAFNQEFCRLLEFPDELVSKKPLSLSDIALFNAQRGEYGPGDPKMLAEQLVAKARHPAAHHFERTRPNGITLEIRGTPLPDGGFVTTYTDISDRKNAEQALEKVSERLKLATSAASIGIWDWTLENDMIVWDDRMFELYGFDPQNSTDEERRQWIKKVHPDDEALVRKTMQSCVSGYADHFDIDFRMTHPNGRIRHINTRIHVERDAGRKPLRIVGANIDISARKQSEERLLLAEKVFDNSPDAIMITDQYNRIVSTNEAFTLITGYAPGEVLGEDPRILSSGMHDTEFFQKMWLSLQRHGHWAGEITDRRKSGEIYPKWMTINAVIDDQSGKLTHYVTMFSDITERKNSEERIHHLAHHDVLTSLPNRFSLESRLEHACREARRHQWKLAVLFIDLDRFKAINDSLGHHIGDRLLCEVAKRLSITVRESDTVGRLGGDEFVILLPDLHTPDDAANVAAKIVEVLGEPICIDDYQLHTSPSIGISLYPMDGTDADTIMRNADTAMYHAKALGRNNFQFYAEEMNRNASERLDIESRLRHALTRNEFELHYQPQLGARRGAEQGTHIVGVEALLRWNAADGRSVPPTRFIPIAEDTGMIIAIGEWVLRTACQQVHNWIKAGVPPLRVAVNVSARQLRKQNFPDIVASALADSGLPAHLLEIEITESAVMEEPEEARLILVKLKEMGVTLAIDDFGTGYSSLAYLKLFPIDNLKIDRSFVTDIGRHADDAAIAISTIALAHSLGINVIAEGVETDAQHDLLREHRCNEFQGYLFSRPLAEADALAFLRQAAIEPI